MRPVFALVLVLFILGSVQAFMMLQASIPAPEVRELLLPPAEGKFTVEIALTFRAEPDGFELEPLALLVQTSEKTLAASGPSATDSDAPPTSADPPDTGAPGANDPFDADPFASDPLGSEAAARNSRVLLRRAEPVPANEVVRLEDVDAIVVGRNELYVKAWTGGDTSAAHAVQVRVLRNGDLIAQDVLWADPGEPVQGKLLLEVPEYAPVDTHEH